MLRYFTALAVLLSFLVCSSFSHGQPSPVSVAIATLNPSLPAALVDAYADKIQECSRRYELDWQVIVAILRQESNFDFKAVNYVTRDFGIGQIHYKNIQHRGIDLGRLLSDAEYAIEETCKILYELKAKYAESDKKAGRKWYTRYNSYTPSKRDQYRAALDRHLRVIEKVIANGRQIETERASAGRSPENQGLGKRFVYQWREDRYRSYLRARP